MQIVNKIKNSDRFVVWLSFMVGLNAKTLYRVQELTDPSRLVINLKH